MYSIGVLSWGYVDFDYTCRLTEVIKEENNAVKYLLAEFEVSGQRKNIVNFDEACLAWKSRAKHSGTSVTNMDIQRAYDLAYGFGCEFEWGN
jgi:hypothetical protein